MKLTDIDSLYEILIPLKPKLEDFSLLFRFFYKDKFEELTNLKNVPISAILEVGSQYKPSDAFEVFNSYFKLKFLTNNDKVLLFYIFDNKMKQISKIFSKIDSIHPIQSKFNGIWSSVSGEFKIPSDVALIARVSKINNCSWKEAEMISWDKVYFMLLLEAQEAAFQNEANKMSKI